jgi:cbb3-type cytochrome oxidase maturation protein
MRKSAFLTSINPKEMNIIFLLIGCSLVLAVGFLLAFIWTVKSGQLEDDYTPSVRMLFEDKVATPDNEEPALNK